MKANEVPEKIYMTPSFGEPDNVLLASFSKSHLNFHKDIEYTRTDVFMEKAIKYIANRFLAPGMDNEINDFVNYMKENKS